MNLQPIEQLELFYLEPDPWAYDTTSADRGRLARFMNQLPTIPYRRVLDIGCGNAFITMHLPGVSVLGCDVSANAVRWARHRVQARADCDRFTFHVSSVFDLKAADLGTFDLIVITGVLYSQYIGNAFALVREIVDELLEPNGILVSCHIADWSPWRFPYTMISADLSEYLDYIHRLEVFIK